MYKINSKIQALDDGVWREGTIKAIIDTDKFNLGYLVTFANFKQKHANATFLDTNLRACEVKKPKRELPRGLLVSSNCLENLILSDEVFCSFKKEKVIGKILINDSFRGSLTLSRLYTECGETEIPEVITVNYEEIISASTRTG